MPRVFTLVGAPAVYRAGDLGRSASTLRLTRSRAPVDASERIEPDLPVPAEGPL